MSFCVDGFEKQNKEYKPIALSACNIGKERCMILKNEDKK